MRAIDVNALTVGMAYLKRSAQRAAAATAAEASHAICKTCPPFRMSCDGRSQRNRQTH